MNSIQWPPRVGAWYLRWDKGEVFQVTAYDESARKAAIRTYDGEPGELDEFTWGCLSLGVADPPEDWTGLPEMVDVVRFGSVQNGPVSEDVAGPITGEW